MLSKDEVNKLYANGICECKAAGRFRWIIVGKEGDRAYMCTKCNRPVYWTPGPPVKEQRRIDGYD